MTEKFHNDADKQVYAFRADREKKTAKSATTKATGKTAAKAPEKPAADEKKEG